MTRGAGTIPRGRFVLQHRASPERRARRAAIARIGFRQYKRQRMEPLRWATAVAGRMQRQRDALKPWRAAA